MALRLPASTVTKGGPPHIAAGLNVPERMLLFCVASGTDWERAGIARAIVTSTVVRGLIQRDRFGQLSLTKHGRATFQALIGGWPARGVFKRPHLAALRHGDAHLPDGDQASVSDDLAQCAAPVDSPARHHRFPRDTGAIVGNDFFADHP
jgi:hypothetical protein